MSDIDEFDRKILQIVQVNNRTTSEQIAEQVGLSPAAVQRRLKRLREQKIITADVSIIDRKAVGLDLTLIVQVSLNNERIDLLDDFKRKMLNHPNVQQCFYVTGSADFVLMVSAQSMEGYNEFTRSMFFGNANIKGFETSVVMDQVKNSLQVSL